MLLFLLLACAPDPPATPAARGRAVYMARCATCHATDPSREGSVGPAVKGASRALLEAKLLHGTYPPGYAPKRTTTAMTPMPELAGQIDDLAAWLQAP